MLSFFSCQIRIPIRFEMYSAPFRLQTLLEHHYMFQMKNCSIQWYDKLFLKDWNCLIDENTLKVVNWRLTFISICLTFLHEMRNLSVIHNSRFMLKSLITLIFTLKFRDSAQSSEIMTIPIFILFSDFWDYECDRGGRMWQWLSGSLGWFLDWGGYPASHRRPGNSRFRKMLILQ